MFTLFAPDVFSAEIGGRFCKNILEQGNMKDNGQLLRDFLQREPSSAAFLKNLGL
jgi:Zn-dependent oligopeptidase